MFIELVTGSTTEIKQQLFAARCISGPGLRLYTASAGNRDQAEKAQKSCHTFSLNRHTSTQNARTSQKWASRQQHLPIQK
jgi:hypothetical protein